MSEDRLFLCPDAVLHPDGSGGVWLLSNPRTRHHVEVDQAAIAALTGCPGARGAEEWDASLAGAAGWDRSGFSSALGLTKDPSGKVDRLGEQVTGADLRLLLVRRRFLIASLAAYDAFLAPLTSPLDRDHLGTFHQRIGQYVLFERRERQTWRWWHSQKFAENGDLQPGPYKYVQEPFFTSYFENYDVKKKRVLDFGCGTGHYSAKFAAMGADVTGIDTAGELIDAARQRLGDKGRLLAPADPAEAMEMISALPAQSFDLIFLGDTFLLLNQNPRDQSGVVPLIGQFRRLLAPDGRVTMVEPNALFWQASRQGDVRRPYAVITEYRSAVYSVAPTLDHVVGVFGKVGFGLVEYSHPPLSPDAPEDPDLAFSREFPIWDLLSFAPIGDA